MRKINLSERQKIILGLVIQEFVEKAQPIGSKFIVDQYNLDLSSATVRNELSILAEEGLLRQPHTSAGRIPTEEGYRYFVQELMRSPDLPFPIRQNDLPSILSSRERYEKINSIGIFHFGKSSQRCCDCDSSLYERDKIQTY